MTRSIGDGRGEVDTAQFVELVAIIVAPTLIFALGLRLPKAVLRVQRIIAVHEHDPSAAPGRPPIEALAADLRRLLDRHESAWRSEDRLMRARRLGALEAAIGDCAYEAGRALGVDGAPPSASGALSTDELRRLLRSLAAAGLVLPPDNSLLQRR
jgi:hypothetical protein